MQQIAATVNFDNGSDIQAPKGNSHDLPLRSMDGVLDTLTSTGVKTIKTTIG